MTSGIRSILTNGKAAFILNDYTSMWWSNNLSAVKDLYYYRISSHDKKEAMTNQMGTAF